MGEASAVAAEVKLREGDGSTGQPDTLEHSAYIVVGDPHPADFNVDVDQEDFGLLQRCLSGSDVPADPDCAG